MDSSAKPRSRRTLAQRTDRYRLYQRAVQCAEAEIDFVDETFRSLRRRTPVLLREDFCGTAVVACEWVGRRRSNLAIGVDRDPAVLDWGRRHNLSKLKASAAARITLLAEDVMAVHTPRVDVLLAMNFSYWIFKQRGDLRAYFARARAALAEDGVFIIDAYGGYDAFRVLRERTAHRGFTYVWHQAAYNPIDGATTCHIDFTFPDGSRLARAFTYEWRLWTLPELREVLIEAGFSRTTVYWQSWDEMTGEAGADFSPREVGDADAGWIAYLVAEK